MRKVMGYRLWVMGGALALSLCVTAQTKDQKLQAKLDNVKAQLAEYDTERTLDSLDQEKLPRLVSGGVFGGANVSNFIITRNHTPMSSHMRVGGELAGFLDFTLTKHFIIEPQVVFFAHQNYFREADGTRNDLWSFGMEIPVYFLGRFGNLTQGYLSFGGGIFTHFTFASNIANKFKNHDDEPTPVVKAPTADPSTEVSYDMSKLYSLHDNHFGVCVQIGYEFSFGMLIQGQYKVSLSDIAGFYSEMKGTEVADALIYPQSASLVIGYRWR